MLLIMTENASHLIKAICLLGEGIAGYQDARHDPPGQRKRETEEDDWRLQSEKESEKSDTEVVESRVVSEIFNFVL